MDVLQEKQLENLFWQILDTVIVTFEEEQRLIEEILLENDDEDVAENAAPPGDFLGILQNFIEVVAGEVLRMEMLEMAALNDVEDDLELELVYRRGDRVIDWRANLPRMEYMRRLEDLTFKTHFRMNRATFEALIVVFGNHLTNQGRLIRLRTELDKCLLMALWIFFNLDTFRSTGLIFGVTRGIVHLVIEALRELAPGFIKWPQAEERRRIQNAVFEKSGFPGFVAAEDGILIRCYAPAIQRERYFDRHQAYSMNVQAICDHRMPYRDIYVGEPGSVNDRRVFSRSPIFNLLLEGQDLVRDDEHIVADGGYTCFSKVLVAFRDLGRMTARQRHFNYKLSSVRMVVERSFGLLRGKHRRLLKLYIKRFEYLIDHVVASMVLHNFMILGGRDADGVCILRLPLPAEPRDYDDFNEDDEELEDNMEGMGAGGEVVNGDPQDEDLPMIEHPLWGAAKVAGREKRGNVADFLLYDL